MQARWGFFHRRRHVGGVAAGEIRAAYTAAMIMLSEPVLLLGLYAATALALLLLVVVLFRQRGARLQQQLAAMAEDNARLERVLREEQRAGRQELAAAFGDFRRQVAQQLDITSNHQREGMTQVALQLRHSLGDLGTRNEKRLGELRGTMETQLRRLQQDNQQQLEKMRATVGEKLQSTLETRLGQSFKLISERLEAVQRGLGEMQDLATGVGDLKRVLTNVKTRGTFGEVQLGALLAQMLSPEQYAANVALRPGAGERVEFAIRLPGKSGAEAVWLPIDAKFPREDHERLLDARARGDADAATAAATALERRLQAEAKAISDKYIAPPHTTDFAILFLPTEGLYAEVISRPGLFEALQRRHHVTLAGPTTLTAILNALQMGFRTLAIEERSSEVWQTLRAVKTEFGKFGDVLDKIRKKLDEAGKHIDATGVRTRAIERQLRAMETLPEDDVQQYLPEEAGSRE